VEAAVDTWRLKTEKTIGSKLIEETLALWVGVRFHDCDLSHSVMDGTAAGTENVVEEPSLSGLELGT
jgi:hypothetical protein